MDHKVKSMKVKTKCGSKRARRHSSGEHGRYVTRSMSGKNWKAPIASVVVKHNGKKSVYCQMYEQEERDIDRAMDVLAKFAHE